MRRLSFVLIILIAATAFAETPKADLVFKNGTIITMEKDMPTATAMSIQGDKISWVGETKDVESRIGPNTKVVDLKGAFVYPGFIDGHAHIVALGDSRLAIDLNDTPNKDVIARLVKERVQKTKKGEWIRGRGWDQNEWPVKEFPTVADLDPVSPDNPVVLERTDGHAIWVNTAALKLAGVTAASKDPDGGKIIRDGKGNPTGVFVDNASALISDKIPAYTQDQIIERTTIALQESARKGVTMIQDAGTFGTEWNAFQRMATENKLPVRIYSMVFLPSDFGNDFLSKGLNLWITICKPVPLNW